MKRVEVTADLKVDKVVKQMKGENVVLMRQGHAVALLSEVDDDELYWIERENDPAFIASIAKARKQIAQGNTISHEELKKELGIE
jgi:PHD/YefM family antitoxin component YafN of YafNO toxin-antitoxin module